jgi:hypothetical protein
MPAVGGDSKRSSKRDLQGRGSRFCRRRPPAHHKGLKGLRHFKCVESRRSDQFRRHCGPATTFTIVRTPAIWSGREPKTAGQWHLSFCKTDFPTASCNALSSTPKIISTSCNDCFVLMSRPSVCGSRARQRRERAGPLCRLFLANNQIRNDTVKTLSSLFRTGASILTKRTHTSHTLSKTT